MCSWTVLEPRLPRAHLRGHADAAGTRTYTGENSTGAATAAGRMGQNLRKGEG